MQSMTVIEAPPAQVETPPCPDCGGLGFLRREVAPGHPDFGQPVKCTHPAHQAKRMAQLARISGLLPLELSFRLSDISVEDGNQEMVKAAREMVKGGQGWLYIHGGPGNAKSIALMAMVNEVNLSGRGPAMYIKLSALIEYMRDSFRQQATLDSNPFADQGYIARFRRILSIPFLAIDEMDKARVTPFAQEFRFDFLDERYRQGVAGQTATVFAGNLDPASLPVELYDRISDGRFSIVENSAASARPGMGK